MLDNLQSKFVLIELFIVLLAILGIFYVFKRTCKVCLRLHSKLWHFLFWNSIFRFLMESYFELCIDCFINLRPTYMKTEQMYDYVGIVFSVGFTLVLVLFPFYCVYIIRNTDERALMYSKRLMMDQGSLYMGLKI